MAGDKAKTKKVQGLRITAKPEVFRRAGFVFTREPRIVALDDLKKLTRAQAESLKNEGAPGGMLVIEEGEFDVPVDDAATDTEATA